MNALRYWTTREVRLQVCAISVNGTELERRSVLPGETSIGKISFTAHEMFSVIIAICLLLFCLID